MRVHVSQHPLVAHKLHVLRDESTSSAVFRQVVGELTTIVALEATAELGLETKPITTPVAEMDAQTLARPRPIAVPILRAGLGMLDAFLNLVPVADAGFLGLKRNETTLKPEVYARRFPTESTGRHMFLLDPMLATGGSPTAAIDLCVEAGASQITCLSLVSSPEGVEVVRNHKASVPTALYLAVIDEGLNSDGYIVPGLGDAGDRLFGVA